MLVKVNVFAALVVPTFRAAYVALAGVRAAGTMPLPDNATVWGLFAALSLKVSVPVTAPTTVGVKVTPTLHFAPAASVAPQVFEEIAKLVLTVMLLMVTEVVPVLVSITVLAALVWLMA